MKKRHSRVAARQRALFVQLAIAPENPRRRISAIADSLLSAGPLCDDCGEPVSDIDCHNCEGCLCVACCGHYAARAELIYAKGTE